MPNELELSVLKGGTIKPYLDELAKLRIQVFREWPYLYDGSLEYERDYLAAYTNCPDSVVVLARASGLVVGASTALPLTAAAEEFRKPLTSAGYALEEVFYLGESVLLSEFRGHGIGHEFFAGREAAAKAYGSRFCAFCAVDRQANDPRCPEDYRELSGFWTRLGYLKQAELQARFKWREVGFQDERENSLTFWIKEL